MRSSECEEILAAASVWKENCFVGGGSLLSEETLWSIELFQELHRCYVENPIEDSRAFIEKLETQLAPASSEAKRLWAEMEWLYYLIVNHVKRETKLDKIKTPWEWSGALFPDESPLLGEVLAKGTVNGGYGFNANRWREMRYIVQCMVTWYGLSDDRRQSLIRNPWDFTDWLDQHPDSRTSIFRHALLFFLFPDSFEDILSHNHKRRITESFNSNDGTGLSVKELSLRELDQELLKVRMRLNSENPDIDVSFYVSPFKEIWNPVDTSIGEDDKDQSDWFKARFGEVNIWLIAPGEGARLWSDFVKTGTVAIGWDDLGDMSRFATKDEMQDALSNLGFSTSACHMTWYFYREMNKGDVVVAKKGRRSIVGYGELTGDYVFDHERPEYKNTRTITWHTTREPIELKKLVATKTLSRIDDKISWLRDVIESVDGVDDAESKLDLGISAETYDVSMALEDVFIDQSQLHRILDAIALRKNLVLQGPPGVGKTYVARRIAWLVMGEKDSSRMAMVQFHQTYSYEDFVQGWRPTSTGGFELKNGVFYEFCQRAIERPNQSFIFIIDEINRGNLSRIFGELLMLIESDKRGTEHAIELTYSVSGETFYVPENVHVLGLMNTADRSLAIVDYALRRRFAFETLEPAIGKPQFRDHLIEMGVDREIVNRIESNLLAVNDKIRNDADLGSGYEIGHSYLVPEGEPDEHWYRVVVETQIAPLLREYWFDHPERVDEIIRDLLN